MSPTDDDPVVLELAALPREQIGPFLLLGVDKDADQEQIEKQWAQRVIAARKNQIRISLADINWARDQLSDPVKRVQADAVTLNEDTSERTLRGLEEALGVAEPAGPRWRPIDVEKPLADYTPPIAVPDAAALRNSIVLPPVPGDVPFVGAMLEQWARTPIDPWSLESPAAQEATAQTPLVDGAVLPAIVRTADASLQE